MNPGPVDSAEHVATSFIAQFAREPLSLALVLMNIALLAFFYVLLTAVAAQRASEVALLYADHKEVRDLLSRCIVVPPPARTQLPQLPQERAWNE